MNIDRVIDGLIKYTNTELISGMNDWQKLIAVDVINRALSRSGAVREFVKSSTFLRALGYVDAEGNVDVEGIAAYLKNAAKECGGLTLKIPLMPSYKFHEDDIEHIYQIIIGGNK